MTVGTSDAAGSSYWTNFSSVPGEYLHESAGIRRGMWTVAWVRDLVGQTEEELNEAASRVPAGSHGLLTVLDWLAPTDEPWRRGAFVGLDARHGAAHLHRSVLEGIALTMQRHTAAMSAELGSELRRLVASGGGARSELMLQILADVFDRPVTRTRAASAASLGAAICAAVGVGAHPSFGAATSAMVHADVVLEPTRRGCPALRRVVTRARLPGRGDRPGAPEAVGSPLTLVPRGCWAPPRHEWANHRRRVVPAAGRWPACPSRRCPAASLRWPGSTISATPTSSNPIRATSLERPSCCRAINAPSQITLRAAKMAVGGSSVESSSLAAVIGLRTGAQAHPLEPRLRPDAGRAERSAIAVAPVQSSRDRGGVSEQGDAPVSMTHEVADSLGSSALVVHHHSVELRESRLPVDRHDDESRGQVRLQPREISFGRHQDQTVDASGDQAVDQLALTVPVLVDARCHHHDAAIPRPVLDGAERLAAEPVGEVLDEHPDGGGAESPAQVAGRQVVAVAQLGHGAGDPGRQAPERRRTRRSRRARPSSARFRRAPRRPASWPAPVSDGDRVRECTPFVVHRISSGDRAS